MIKSKYLLIGSILIFTFISIFGIRADIKSENKLLSGRLEVNIYQNSEKVLTQNSLIYGPYMLEPNVTAVNSSRVNIGKDGNQELVASSSGIVTKSYFLSNLKDSTCSEFDTVGTMPVFKAKIAIDRKTGFKIKGTFKESLEKFVYTRDTTIDHKSYKILIYDYKDIPSQPKEYKIALYLLKSPEYFPFHPFSTFLDNKFGGIVTRLIAFGTHGQSQFIEYNFKKGLDKSQEDRIKKFIAADKKHQSK